ncbi:peptidylprolyl isomerase [Streptomyces sp. ZAF1911]|uniref:peptidylprolyl isomerase n=1 Tax=Streptomyces sp. ZAF1911 TaxID=2944129 RepID=UPI00237B3701|nr:peptidylprolyl isomerase [Streptomyces sp. ZAF1911]MDD9378595.1 peptidylprolyl isomerase [Streptomyces sp. ZAF1911]
MHLTSGTKSGGRRAGRKAAIAIAAVATCSGLTWTALSLTGGVTDSKPPVTCTYTPSDGGTKAAAPGFDAVAAARPYTVRIDTEEGPVTIEALTKDAPCTTNSFSFLAGKKYFDGSKCHRVTTRGIFVLECGDPAGEGNSDPGYWFKDENLAGASYPAGTVAMSKALPGKNGSQFFISYADPTFRMPPSWTPFGKVVGGLDAVAKIAAKGTADGSTDGKPKEPVVIKSVTVQRPAK